MRNRFPLDSYHLSSGRFASVYGTFQTQKIQGEIALFFPTTFLVGGIPTPLKNMKISWGYELPN